VSVPAAEGLLDSAVCDDEEEKPDMHVDAIDKQLIAALQADARRPLVSLARDLDMAPSSVRDRMSRLESRGVITGYAAITDARELGWGVQAFLLVRLDRHEQDFESHMLELPQVRACYMVSGRFDYIVHVAGADIDELGTFVREGIEVEPGVPRVESAIVFRTLKSEAGWPAR